MFAQFSAIDNVAEDRVRRRREHAKLDKAVPQKDTITAGDIARQALVGGADAGAGAGEVARRDRETLSRAQLNRSAAHECARANFRSLQIGQDSDGLREARRSLA